MKPSRVFRRLAPGVAAGALLAVTAGPALAADAPKGSLRSREFSAAELAVSSSHVPLDDVLGELPNRGAWERFRSERASGGAERVHVFIDPRSGVATDIIAPFPLLPGDGVGNRVGLAELSARLGREVGQVDAAIVAEAARLFVLEHAGLLGIAAAQLGTLRATQVSDTLWQVSAPQVVAGITVRDARLALTISHGNVVAFGTEGWGTVALPTEAAVAAEKAMAAAFAYAGGRALRDVVLQTPTFEIVATAPRGNARRRALHGPASAAAMSIGWSTAMTFQRPPEEGRWETLVDAVSGEVMAFRDKNHYENRQVTGGVYPLTNTGQCSTPQVCGAMQSGWPMPFADTGLPAPNNVTNSAGVYDFTGVPITTTLTGPFVDIVDTCGPINASSATGDLDLGGLNGQHDCVIGDGGGPGNTAASRSAFYELNKLAEQGRGWLPGNTWLRSRLGANVNILQTCNAFWNGTTVNFFRSGGGCGNTGEIAAVFDHEWGHGLDDNDANGAISNSSEGYADIAAIYRLQASCVGHGFSVGDHARRLRPHHGRHGAEPEREPGGRPALRPRLLGGARRRLGQTRRPHARHRARLRLHAVRDGHRSLRAPDALRGRALPAGGLGPGDARPHRAALQPRQPERVPGGQQDLLPGQRQHRPMARLHLRRQLQRLRRHQRLHPVADRGRRQRQPQRRDAAHDGAVRRLRPPRHRLRHARARQQRLRRSPRPSDPERHRRRLLGKPRLERERGRRQLLGAAQRRPRRAATSARRRSPR